MGKFIMVSMLAAIGAFLWIENDRQRALREVHQIRAWWAALKKTAEA